jgi:hypothetical protein
MLHSNHSTWNRLLLWGIILFILAIPFGTAQADIGPKPSMNFTFEYVDMAPLTILGGALIECEDRACTEGSPLEELGPQNFTCRQDTCHSLAYGYAPYHRLMIDFSDGVTRQSNVFEKRAYNANYTVTVRPDGMQVKEGWGTPEWLVGGMMLGLVIGPLLLCLVGLGGLALVIFFIIRGGQSKVNFGQSKALFILSWIASLIVLVFGSLFYLPLLMLVVVEEIVAILGAILLKAPKLSIFTVTLLANLLTIPLSVLGVISMGTTVASWQFILLWAVSWLLESLFLGLSLRHELGFSKAFGLSLIMNLASLAAGFLLPPGLGFG